MFDTHCHLNFSRFKKNVDEVIETAHRVGVTHIVIPGTDIKTSRKGIEIAATHENMYAAVGIHPHHVFDYSSGHSEESSDEESGHRSFASAQDDISQLEKLITHPKVVAVGEIGLDKHTYKETKYENYTITDDFFSQQKKLFIAQLQLAANFNKSVILHNREAIEDFLKLLTEHWDKSFSGRMVFHCCEPKKELLEFAKEHKTFLGVDGDITYEKEKQEFIKQIPLDMLVVETDSPFLLPEPMRSRKEFPNEPRHIPFIISCIANILGKKEQELQKQTFENSTRLFNM